MAYADHHMAQMCHISGLHFLEDNVCTLSVAFSFLSFFFFVVVVRVSSTSIMSKQDFFAALGAFGNACKLDPVNGLFMQSFRNAAVAYNISRFPTMDVLLYDQAPEPFSVAAVPSFIEGLTSYLQGVCSSPCIWFLLVLKCFTLVPKRL